MLFLCYPKCSTCQRAKKWLEEHRVEYELRDIKLQSPTEAELRAWREKSGLPLKRFFNTSGLQYKSLGLSARLPDMPEEEQYKLLSSDGMLVKRPILIDGDRVLVGFKVAEYAAALES